VLSEGNTRFAIVATYTYGVVVGEAGAFPAEEGRGELFGDETPGEEELHHGAAEGFGELPGVVYGQEEESPVGGEASFQDECVPVGVRSQEVIEGLEGHDGCGGEQPLVETAGGV